MQEAVDSIDLNKDGYIDGGEMQNWVETSQEGVTPEEVVDAVMDAMDSNMSGMIDSWEISAFLNGVI